MNLISRTYRCLFCILPLLWVGGAMAQDIESNYNRLKKRIKEEPVKITGNLSAQGASYHSFGIYDRGIPYRGSISGAVALDILGVTIHSNINIGSGGKIYNTKLPSYNFIGLSPKYKWVTLHIGNRTMDINKYSFSSYSFNGAGIELSPGNWRFKSFYGTLQRIVPRDYIGAQSLLNENKRIGFASKIGYDDGKDAFYVSLFKAEDRQNNTGAVLPDSMAYLPPGENVILSLEMKKALGKILTLDANYSSSGYTEDQSSQKYKDDPITRTYGGLLGTNVSTTWSNAIDFGLTVKIKKTGINLLFQKIDPDFKTMGSMFFQNDLQNIHLGINSRLLKDKVQLNARGGIQQNNMSGNKSGKYRRVIASLNLSASVTERIRIYAYGSTFNNVNTRIINIDPTEPLSRLEIVMNNEEANGGIDYTLISTPDISSSVSGMFNISSGQSVQNDILSQDASTSMSNYYINYNINLIRKKMGFGLSVGRQDLKYTRNKTSNNSINVSFNKRLLDDKVNFNANYSLVLNNQNDIDAERVEKGMYNNIGIGAGYSPTKKISIMIMIQGLSSVSKSSRTDNKNFGELRTQITSNYNF